MHTKQKRRWAALGAVFGAGVAAVVVAALTAFVTSGGAAGKVAPVNTSPADDQRDAPGGQHAQRQPRPVVEQSDQLQLPLAAL